MCTLVASTFRESRVAHNVLKFVHIVRNSDVVLHLILKILRLRSVDTRRPYSL